MAENVTDADRTTVEFDTLATREAEKLCGKFDDFRREHQLTDEQTGALIRRYFGLDVESLWLEFVEVGEDV